MSSVVKSILTALGALVVIVFTLSLVIGLFSGDGSASFKDKVAVVKVEGLIADSTALTTHLRDLGRRKDVKAVVIRIDSPGGGVGASQEIYSEVRHLKEIKPVVASLGGVAASGGFYIAIGAEKVVANPGSITGSIGVIAKFMNAEELLSKVGLHGYVLKSGLYKDAGSPFREMTPEERTLLQGLIDDLQGQFVDAVASGRELPVDKVKEVADGRVFSGAEALKLGFVDKLGGLMDAVELAGSLSGIDGAPEIIYPQKRPFDFGRDILGDGGRSLLSGLTTGLNMMYLMTN